MKVDSNLSWGGAVFCYIMAAAGTSVTIEGPKENYIISIALIIAFLIGGIALTKNALSKRKKYKHYKEYMNYITARGKIKVEELAKIMVEKPEDVIRNISEMINTKMINGYISENNEIILNSYVEQKQKTIQNMQRVKCESCGATNNYIVGRENKCEYCGSYLKKT